MARSGPRPGLDEAAVLGAAAELVDTDGLDALSLAQLASALGVQTPSLYNHVAGLEGVRRGLAVLGVRELRDRLARAAIGVSGAAAIYAIAEAYRRFAKEHPGLYAASLRAPTAEETELTRISGEILDIIRAVLGAYELRGEEEIHVLRAFRSLAHGFVSLELAGGFGIPVDLDTSYRALVDLLLAGLEQRRKPDGETRGAS
jgi:AcrR family transcriptional regulator